MSQTDLITIPKHNDSGLAFIQQVTKWGFLLDGVTEAAPGINFKCAYFDPTDQSYVYFTEDQMMGVAYYGAGGFQKSGSIELVRSMVLCWTDDEILDWWDQAYLRNDIDGMVDSVIRLGLTSPIEQDSNWFDRILAACHSYDKDVRNAAVVAVGVRMWPVFKGTIVTLAESDLDNILRQRAELVKQGWPE